jgi:magnesium-transporting ATPase (P-type)
MSGEKLKDDTPYRYIFTSDPNKVALQGKGDVPEEAPKGKGPIRVVKTSNTIVTSKYNAFNFLPRFLFEFFSQVANTYFLVVSCLQCVKEISNTDGYPYTAGTLFVIFLCDATFAVLEDSDRHKADNVENSRICHIYNRLSSSFEDKKSRFLKVGDIVEVKGTEAIPADMILLYVNTANRQPGVPPDTACYVETKGLDGESNQKVREAHGKAARLMEDIEEAQGLSPEEAVGQLDLKLRCELPNVDISNFDGSLFTTGVSDPSTEATWGEAIALHSVLLRGCRLQQEGKGSVYGLVVFTGRETKVQMSAGETPSKLR